MQYTLLIKFWVFFFAMENRGVEMNFNLALRSYLFIKTFTNPLINLQGKEDQFYKRSLCASENKITTVTFHYQLG